MGSRFLGKRADRSGALLAEVLLCALLVSVALGVMAAAIMTWERSILNSRERAGAYFTAKQQMEYCLGVDFDELETLETTAGPKIMEVRRTVGSHQIDSVYETTVEVETLPSERVKSVEVQTSFERDNGAPVKLYTLVYQSS